MNKKREVKHQYNTGGRKALQTLKKRAQRRRERLIEETREEEESGSSAPSHPSRSILNDSEELGVRPGHRSFTGAQPWKPSSFQALEYIKINDNFTAMRGVEQIFTCVLSSGEDKCHKCKEIASDICVFSRKPGPTYSSSVACLLLVPNLHLTPWTMKGFEVKAVFCENTADHPSPCWPAPLPVSAHILSPHHPFSRLLSHPISPCFPSLRCYQILLTSSSPLFFPPSRMPYSLAFHERCVWSHGGHAVNLKLQSCDVEVGAPS